MNDFRLFLRTEVTPIESTVTFGLDDIRDRIHATQWKTLASNFLISYLAQRLTVLRIETATPYDWYSEYCAEHNIDACVTPGPNSLIRIYARPKQDQLFSLIAELVGDEAWDIGGLLTIATVNTTNHGDLAHMFAGAFARLCPVADGQAVQWTGPASEALQVQALIRDIVAKSGALLVGQG